MTAPSRRGALRMLTAALLLFGAGLARGYAQMHFGGQASAAWISSQPGPSQYSFNGGRSSFAWRGDLFLDAELSDNVLFLSSFRMEQDRKLYADLFVLRVTDVLDLPLNIEAGETEIPFGNLGERRYPKTNPFLSLPLGREHYTTMRSADYEIYTTDPRYSAAGNNIRLLDGGLYDLGVKAFGTIGIVDYAFAVTNGMLSSSGAYASDGLNGSKGIGKIARLSVTPMIGLTIGASWAQGPFLNENRIAPAGYAYPNYYDPMAYQQHTVGGDIDFSYGHFAFYGETFFNRWDFAGEYGSDLDAFGYSAEARYALLPRLSAGLRVGELRFNKISRTALGVPVDPLPWDHDVMRVETALGYRVSREMLLKAVYVWNRTFGLPSDPRDDSVGIQSVVSF